MRKFFHILTLLILVLAFFVSIVPVGQVFAQARPDYVALSPLPGATNADNKTTSFPVYVTGIFNLGIGIAGVLAVMVIIFEGISHMLSESFTKKSDTVQRIQAALAGLLLALLAYLILQAINPALVNFNLTLKPVADSGRLQFPRSADALMQELLVTQANQTQQKTIELRKNDQDLQGEIDEIILAGCDDAASCEAADRRLDELEDLLDANNREIATQAEKVRLLSRTTDLKNSLSLDSWTVANVDKIKANISDNNRLMQEEYNKLTTATQKAAYVKEAETSCKIINAGVSAPCAYIQNPRLLDVGRYTGVYAYGKEQLCQDASAKPITSWCTVPH